MALDVAMGGSTNTVLHLLAAAHEAHVGFGLKDIDELSRRVPCLCKVAPSSDLYHVEDVHRAGGIPAILGELDRGGRLNRGVPCVHSASLGEFLSRWDVRSPDVPPDVVELFHAAPAGVRTVRPYSQDARWETLDLDRTSGCVRDVAHAYTRDGGLAVLYGNLAPAGAIVKTAAGGATALAETGDLVEIDIPGREIRLAVPDDQLRARRERLLAARGSYHPAGRQRAVSDALRVYAAMATSASTGAVRDISLIGG